jgi:ActR/RegA family two-component response regulator
MNRTVLMVDGNASVLAELCTAFARAGYAPRAVQCFGDALATLQFVDACAVVASMELEPQNGVQRVLRKGAVAPATKIVVMGPASATLEKEARALGASAYLPRPVNAATAVDTVNALLARAAAARSVAPRAAATRSAATRSAATRVLRAPSHMRDLPIFLER